ncbi:MAG: trmB [Chlamydiia bacterium]|nr:trmB [Chlamydiia bacterium]
MKKAKDLHLPFAWEDRQPVLHERLWYLPGKIDWSTFSFPGFQAPSFFANSKPVHIEYCSGNGSWIIDRAKRHPEINFLAVEQRFDRARKIWAKMHNAGLQNLIVALAEGHAMTKTFIPDSSVTQIYINFPDPWPKRRHAKYRIINPTFIAEMHRILADNGTVTIVTDDADYSTSIIKEMLAHAGFLSAFDAPYFAEASSEYGTSYFDELFRSKGKIIKLHQFRKQSIDKKS